MNLGAWLPQVLALVPSLGAALIGLFANRKKRAMSEFDKLIDLRERCKPGSVEASHLEAAIESVSKRVSETMRRRVVGSGVAAVIFIGLLVFGGMYPVWLWVFRSGELYAWLVALLLSSISVAFVVAGFPSMFKTDEEIEKAAEERAAKKRATKAGSS